MGLFSIFRRNKTELQESKNFIFYGASGFSLGGGLKALENSTVWICIMNLCKAQASTPLHVYDYNKNNEKYIDKDCALAKSFKHPNDLINTSYEWRFIMAFNFEFYGIAYALAVRNRLGEVISLHPLSPNVVEPKITNGVMKYKVTDKDNKEHFFTNNEMLVIKHYPIGINNYINPINYATKDLEVANNARELQNNYYRNGANVGSIVYVPSNMSDENKKTLHTIFKDKYSGSSNAFKTMVLDDSIKFETIKLNEKDTEKLKQAQNWTLQEVCRRFGVPPFFAGDLTKATYANSEQQNKNLIDFTLQPRAVIWEESLNNLCIGKQFCKLDLRGYLRGDHATRAGYYQSMVTNGLMTPNEIRALEDLPPMPNGDDLMFPLNFAKLGYEPQQQPSVWDLPTEESKKVKENVKKLEEREYISEVVKVTQSHKKKIESIIKKQVKSEIQFLKDSVIDNKAPDNLLKMFRDFTKENCKNFEDDYLKVYQSILNRLLPIVKKQAGVDTAEDSKALEDFALKYAKSFALRHGKYRNGDLNKALKNLDDNEDIENAVNDLGNDWLVNVPANESNEEIQRSGNAFNLAIMGAIGLTYMHVVAHANACDFCQQIDGKTVEVNGSILVKGSDLADGKGSVLKINKNYKHPPFHRGCTCGIAPGKGA